MTPNEAFDYVLNEYKITAENLSRVSGLDKSAISKFRNGKHQMNSDNLQKLIQSLPPKPRTHFSMLFSFGGNETVEKVVNTKPE